MIQPTPTPQDGNNTSLPPRSGARGVGHSPSHSPTSIEILGFEPETGALHFFGKKASLKFADGASRADIISRDNFRTLFVAVTVPPDRKIESLSVRGVGSDRFEVELPHIPAALRGSHSLPLAETGEWFGTEGLPDYKAGSAWHVVLRTRAR